MDRKLGYPRNAKSNHHESTPPPPQRALRDIFMSRGKKYSVSRQFLTRNYPRPNYFPNCLSPTREGISSSFKISPAVRAIARQLRDKNKGLIFGKGMRTATFQFSESGGSDNSPNLFTELPSCLYLNCLTPFHRKTL